MGGEIKLSVELRLRAAVESSPSGLLMIDRDGRMVLVNREIERLFGYPREELLGQSIEILVPPRFRDRHPGFRSSFFADPRTRAMGAGRDLFGLRKDGTEIPVEIGLNPIATEEGLFVLSSVVDISARQQAERERRDLEEQLRQSQKMESLGRLAGGIAHDFNNLLGSIIGFAELIREEVTDRPGVRTDVDELLKSAMRGKEVVERIMLFSRRKEVELRPLDLARVIREAEKLLRVSLPSSIEIRFHVPDEPARVQADSTAIHQVLMNLAGNASQAMRQGGRLDIVLDQLYARDTYVRLHPGLREGPYARLVVRDSGCGMDAATRARAFEPFFTTKPPGSGTGLGLAIVHTILRNHGGAVWLDSEPEHGTTVTCLLPLMEPMEMPTVSEARAPAQGAGERILLVDDEAALLHVSARRLERMGYAVNAIADPQEALASFRAAPEAFDLVVTDYSMPRMNGMELATQISHIRAGQPLILLTGYLDDMPAAQLKAAGIGLVVKKPATAQNLADAIQTMLKSPRNQPAG